MTEDPYPQQLPTLERLGVPEPAEGTSAIDVASTWLNAFSSAVGASDVPAILDLFVDDGFWKDTLALTWDFRSIEGRESIKNMLDHRLAATGLTDVRSSDEKHRTPVLQKMFPDLVFVVFGFEFSTRVGRGSAVCHLVPVPGSTWKAYVLYTCLDALEGFPETVGPLRKHEAEHGTWEARRRREIDLADGDPTVLVIGAGHCGLETAARLKYLGVSHLVIDKKPRVGDNWRDRYKALSLHDTVWYNQTPYLSFPPTWPVYSPASKLADWLESYADFLELNVWTSSVVTKTAWNDKTKTWTVEIDRGGKPRTITVRHLVFATSYVTRPNMPDIPGRADFKGTVVHSSEFTSAADYTSKKRALIVGACNSGHDIAKDFLDHGVDTTMYQRSSTYVISSGAVEHMLGTLYNDVVPIETADLLFNALPDAVARRIHQRVVPHIAQTVDKELLDGLASVGFKTNLGPNGAGVFQLLFLRAGGYYLDVGASKHIVSGDIKLKNGSAIERYTEKGLRFADGTELEADVIVFATGFGDTSAAMRDICGPDVAKKVKPVWGLTDEGELSGIWRASGHDGLWFAIGNLGMGRFHSRHLALQIKAIEVGILNRSEAAF